ncbi:MAG: di-heme cytochrome c peroxidase [Rhodospirillaceae bacterium]|nr:MAG: di-heme cytochrome c peroxidase [Rhodospirillaceae bacterium]
MFAKTAALAAAVMVSAGVVSVGGAAGAMAQAANPCAPKAANPCAAKPMNPCAAKAANPCAAKAAGMPEMLRPKDTKLATGDHKQLVEQGEALFKDTKLSTNGMSCNSCHADLEAFQPTFAQPYPHQVAMANEQAGISSIALDEMIQLCMVVPMEAKPLKWDSKELAALTAHTGELQKQYRKQAAANPCAAKPANPCAAKAANPCAAKPANPCAAKKW